MHACVLIIIIVMHIIGAIEVSIATMLKGNHSKSEVYYICGFVPIYLLPKKRPNSLDPFLHPLVEKVEELFINGNSFCIIMHVCLKAGSQYDTRPYIVLTGEAHKLIKKLVIFLTKSDARTQYREMQGIQVYPM